jgi:acetyltransferase-like isoleucine patch superfamily enzyme
MSAWRRPVASLEPLKVGGWMLVEKLLRWCVHPRLRARCLGLLGASVGRGVRIYEVVLINPFAGFSNLRVGEETVIGAGTMIDLTGAVEIGSHTAIAPGCTLITHSDPGSRIGNRLTAVFPRTIAPIHIGSHVWIGAQTLILAGVAVGDGVVIGAGSLVNKDIPPGVLAYGRPASPARSLNEATA